MLCPRLAPDAKPSLSISSVVNLPAILILNSPGGRAGQFHFMDVVPPIHVQFQRPKADHLSIIVDGRGRAFSCCLVSPVDSRVFLLNSSNLGYCERLIVHILLGHAGKIITFRFV
jgi:hypothetical protein